MNVLVVHAHPNPESFNHALFDTAVRALRAGGHRVTAVDLYAERFHAAMSRDEHRAYQGDDPIVDPRVAAYASAVREAEAMVFVYPTWWSGVPAILKGWLERVLVPGVGFVLDERTGKVRPGLVRLRRIVGISTYGSRRSYVMAMTDGGRRVLTRALRMSAGWRTRATWLGLYSMDAADDAQRAVFLARVDAKLRSL
jgi:putative NADPH-quinone reductase